MRADRRNCHNLMPRKKRIWYKGACFHVMGRGVRRGSIFREEEDYRLFMFLLEQMRSKYPFTLHAFCLMTNHFHLQITTGSDPIWMIMQPLMTQYARNFNKKYNLAGHLFDSRYTSSIIEDQQYFLEVSRYIHLNPVKADMVREPLLYNYSSYQNYTGETDRLFYAGVDTGKILEAFLNNSRERYRNFVEGRISHTEQELLIQKDIKENELWLPV